jgi:hypothetical protein
MSLRDAFSRFLRGKADSRRSTGDESDGSQATVLDNVADDIDAGDDATELVRVLGDAAPTSEGQGSGQGGRGPS